MVKTAMGPPLDASWECQTMQHFHIFGKNHAAVKKIVKVTKFRKKIFQISPQNGPF